MITAKDIMTHEVVTISPQATIHDATETLLNRSVSGLPVVDHKGVIVGILTEFALLATAYDQTINNDTVADHMTCDVMSVDVNDPINKVADLFIVHRVRRVPVVENGRLAGLVARRDVLKALHESSAPYAVC
ncbi:Hypoxic response protein 1 [Botrimarina colliarenosi]|uniref:Hypoxic response protein 1 n=1 Tax=Botrimarina colliarenosi TaxID=2528001 RepID=A0A5C6AEY4_9BACT|nr:CBS domain-containing protein [Botrimarina colliarenosi]TWT97878.1 Hypoxic response protein 1 [Botrimarina colliarenosi]